MFTPLSGLFSAGLLSEPISVLNKRLEEDVLAKV